MNSGQILTLLMSRLLLTKAHDSEGKIKYNKYTWILMGQISTLLMLRLLFTKAQGRKVIWNPFKPCHISIHWEALAECFQMITYVPEFLSFFKFFVSFCIGQNSHQQHKGQSLKYFWVKGGSYFPKVLMNLTWELPIILIFLHKIFLHWIHGGAQIPHKDRADHEIQNFTANFETKIFWTHKQPPKDFIR